MAEAGEFKVKYTPPADPYFTATMDKAAAFDLKVTLEAVVREFGDVPPSVRPMLDALTAAYDTAEGMPENDSEEGVAA